MWCVAPLEMNEVTHLEVRVQSAFDCGAEKAPLRDLFFWNTKLCALLHTDTNVTRVTSHKGLIVTLKSCFQIHKFLKNQSINKEMTISKLFNIHMSDLYVHLVENCFFFEFITRFY